MLAPTRTDQEHLHTRTLTSAVDGFESRAGGRRKEAMLEPGLDRHEWESRWQALEEPMADAPAETLPELDALVQQMLEERGYAIDDPVAQEGDDREIVAEFLSAREITRLLDERSDDVSPGDVAAAVNGYRSVYEYLLAERSAP